uniref:Uncharacterized protein n=1 Tax=Mycena chlorophos TaxID=658473 RepID=A0ABQ0M2Y3_MYCCL|nr:predicted protein [Mycena chlorophos]
MRFSSSILLAALLSLQCVLSLPMDPTPEARGVLDIRTKTTKKATTVHAKPAKPVKAAPAKKTKTKTVKPAKVKPAKAKPVKAAVPAKTKKTKTKAKPVTVPKAKAAAPVKAAKPKATVKAKTPKTAPPKAAGKAPVAPAKGTTSSTTKATSTTSSKAVPAGASCPVPAKKTKGRRMLEFLGLVKRTPPADCDTGSSTPAVASKKGLRKQKQAAAKAAKAAADAPAPAEGENAEAGTSAAAESGAEAEPEPAEPAEEEPPKAAKSSKGKGKAAAAKEPAAAPAAAPAAPAAPATPAKPPVGTVANKPTKNVKCTNSKGGQTIVTTANLLLAITRAQETPVFDQTRPLTKGFFPHVFNNKIRSATTGRLVAEVNLPAGPCQTEELIEQAVGTKSMKQFSNSIREDFPFRVVITKPDSKGDTTFCGVITHGTSTAPVAPDEKPPPARFLQDPCPDA